ncbi:hypothetical protein Syun_010179 [Stephania yunnanensis]|uniref:Uncharacterized protein n=1 Tax=Stephania yunnanensis TaxID=152371 RepID=A0AAP0PRJ9_9MAGN
MRVRLTKRTKRRTKKKRSREGRRRAKQGGRSRVLESCDLVNVRGKVVISSFSYNGLANPTKNGGIV